MTNRMMTTILKGSFLGFQLSGPQTFLSGQQSLSQHVNPLGQFKMSHVFAVSLVLTRRRLEIRTKIKVSLPGTQVSSILARGPQSFRV